MPLSSWICLVIIGVATIVFFVKVIFYKKKDRLISKRRIVEYFPTVILTLGVLGTFYGITIGLISFDTSNLDESIPCLLDGLKTAFFTSLAGMFCSMVLSSYINIKQDEKDKGVSDINQAAGIICQAVGQMGELNREMLTKLSEQMAESERDRKAFCLTIGDIMDKVNQSQSAITETLGNMNTIETEIASNMDSLIIIQRSQEGALANISEISSATLNSIGNLEESNIKQIEAIVATQKYSEEISEFTHHLPEILDVLSGMGGTQDDINEQVQKLKDILDAEVLSIEEGMNKTNKLLEYKFDEFTELLKKSNTEALVEVMKKVTEEFQKQMNMLINKLIQENFDQLNKSVERLNQWQQENKEMITSLTRQYKEMATNFEATSTSLDKVKDDTATLVGEGGKLRQLIDALNEVIVNDQKFLEISTKLQQTAELSHSNMESFDVSTKALNDWVRKQRNFVDTVQLLLDKLDEISKIKDYNEQFWHGTKRSLEEGLDIIRAGSQTLNSQLTNLDRQFYARLGTTLAELDSCIQSMVKGK